MSGFGAFIVACCGALLLGVVVLLDRLILDFPWSGWITVSLVVAVLILVALPFAEEIWIAKRFDQMCKDAGVHVLRKVEVDGFYDDTGGGGEFFLKRSAYRFVEGRGQVVSAEAGRRNVYWRVEKVGSEIRTSRIDHPSARYHLRQSRDHEAVGHRVWASEFEIIDSQSGETIARDTRFFRYPNVVDAAWMARLGSPLTWCPAPGDANATGTLRSDTLLPLHKE